MLLGQHLIVDFSTTTPACLHQLVQTLLMLLPPPVAAASSRCCCLRSLLLQRLNLRLLHLVKITYGSVIKLMHEKTKFRLHSHDVPYGSGSGQQSVTGFPNVKTANR
ncbi:hypothetical protein L1987_80022 [Smallanthus sonchifolius]|uniref:Uncharacterized protein n=1 Tax=Smallanthus sonchifolius TaxID=185202 RepID=A0ACB8YKU2_9ASTR|nr:hypothetical protein L1987_80022 [Smallanthus sonchifolius]